MRKHAYLIFTAALLMAALCKPSSYKAQLPMDQDPFIYLPVRIANSKGMVKRIRIGECEYLMVASSYSGDITALTHAGDCDNKKHQR